MEYLHILPCAYFVLLEIDFIPDDCMFHIGPNWEFKTDSLSGSDYDGKHVMGISQGGKDIDVAPGLTFEPSRTPQLTRHKKYANIAAERHTTKQSKNQRLAKLREGRPPYKVRLTKI